MSVQGAMAASLRRFDPYPEAILALDFAGVRTGGRQFYKREGIIVPRFEMLRGAASVGHAGFGVASVNGALRRFAPGASLVGDGGLSVPELRTNKNSNFNANPTDLTGLSGSAVSDGRVSVVSDEAALAAAGLEGLCSSGKVVRINNAGNPSSTDLLVSGVTGNANVHTLSAFMRGTGTGSLRIATFVQAVAFALTPAYIRTTGAATPLDAAGQFRLRVDAGGDCYFILNQLEEGSFATAPIVVQGAPATRTAVAQSVGGVVLPPIHSGAVRFRWVGAEANAFPVAFTLDDNTAESRILVYRINANGGCSVLFKSAADQIVLTLGAVGLGVDHVVAWRAEPGNYAACLNGGAVATSSGPIVLPTFSHLRAGHVRTNPTTNVGNGVFATSEIYDKPFSNSRLQALCRELAA